MSVNFISEKNFKLKIEFQNLVTNHLLNKKKNYQHLVVAIKKNSHFV